MIILLQTASATTTGEGSSDRGAALSVRGFRVPMRVPSRDASGLRYLWQAMVGGLSIPGRVCTRAGFLEVRRGH
jgi:hypothetical protein